MSLLKVSEITLQEAGNLVLKEISFTQQAFQKIAIAGETGSGKSTLLQTIAGLVQPSSGMVLFRDKRITGPQDQLIPGHPGIAYLSQQFELPQFLRVEQVLKYAKKLTDKEANTLYEVCRISHLLKRRTDHLSGGERQRIALTRLLLSSPKLLLLDEPFSNLDIIHKNILKAVIHDIGELLGITLMLISHDPLDTLSWADKILVMKEGKIIQQGSPEQIYKQPVNEYTAALFGSYNLLSAKEIQNFAGLPEIDLNGKIFLFRPENLKIVTNEKGAIPGIVNKIKYFGSYYEIIILMAGTTAIVKTSSCNLVIGAKVYITLQQESFWYV